MKVNIKQIKQIKEGKKYLIILDEPEIDAEKVNALSQKLKMIYPKSEITLAGGLQYVKELKKPKTILKIGEK